MCIEETVLVVRLTVLIVTDVLTVTYRVAHERTPGLWQEVPTGGRKHTHQLLQGLELPRRNHTQRENRLSRARKGLG